MALQSPTSYNNSSGPSKIIFLAFAVLIAATLLAAYLFLNKIAEEKQSAVESVSAPKKLGETERLAILNQLSSSTTTFEQRQKIVNGISGATSTMTLEEKQKVLEQLIGGK